MSKTKRYDKEFKIMLVELMLSGHSAQDLSKEYGVHAASVRSWKRSYLSNRESFTGSGTPSLTPEEKEIRELKRQLRDAQMERDILKKVVSIFSKNDRKSTNL
jgi:transposase